MKRVPILIFCMTAAFSMTTAFAAPAKKAVKPASESKKNFSFDDQLVEGEVYRPDYSVVTGEAPGEGWGVLRMRPSFADHSTTDAEEKKP